MSAPKRSSRPSRGPARGPARNARPGPSRTAQPEPVAKKKRPAPRKTPAPKTAVEQAAAQAARVLTGAAMRYLRGLGHHLDPVLQIGKDGITDGVVAALKTALFDHELVKVRVLQDAPIDRKEAGPILADRAGASLAQTLGRTLLLYKRHPHKPTISIPR